MLLSDKVALVTGAAGVYGGVLSRTLAAHGARVAMVDRDGERLERVAALLRGAGADVLPITADLTADGAPEAVVAEMLAAFGRLDLLVNNAARLLVEPLERVSLEAWDATVAVNVRAAYALCQAVRPAMEEQGSGAIVNVTSIAARTAAMDRSVYALSKAALHSVTQSVAAEWGRLGIRCNSISFGGLPWSMSGSFDDADGDLADPSLPLGRRGARAEFAEPVVFLASDMASYVTGTEVVIDGGRGLTLLGLGSPHRPEAYTRA
ncbi:MAG TPA: SDR family NAD(P)-dependent oxidoreductase [Baekduia sp.]